MILKVTFGDGGQGNAGRVNSTINADLMESRFDLEGVFNHQGVISGTATLIRNETTAWREQKSWHPNFWSFISVDWAKGRGWRISWQT